jgi:PadR family transcriptional regulator, regulatory protein PadR
VPAGAASAGGPQGTLPVYSTTSVMSKIFNPDIAVIVGDVKDAGLDEPSPPQVYIAHAQIGISDMTTVVRSALPPAALARTIEVALRELDPDLPLAGLKTLNKVILSLIEQTPRHGYDIAQLIEARSGGVIQFKVASLYPLLYRLEARGWIHGRWVEKSGQRRRRYYRLTADGKKVLAAQRSTWEAFAAAIARVTGARHP